MAIVRELTTLLDFQLDTKGVDKYQAAANKIKEIGLGLGKLFGIVFAADKIFSMVDGLIHAGKEANILVYQLTRMARAGDDVNEVQKQLFQTAQDTGIEYTEALGTYKEFLNESRELNVSQDQLLKTTSNIFKALRLGAASPEAIQATMATFERSFRMGRMGRRQFGMLTQQAPEVVNALAESLGKTREQLEEMSKAGDITAKVLIDGLGKVLPKLDKDFAARPRKLGESFNYAWNAAVKLSMQLWKLLSANSMVAKGIIWLVDQVVNGLTAMTAALGGIEHVLRLLEITMAVVFGPKLLMMIYSAAVAMRGWAASTWLTVGGYAALAIAIAGIVLLIEDIIVWMRGGKSVMGDMLGPFDKFVESFKKLFKESDFFASFRMLEKLFKGDFGGAWKELKTSIRDVSGLLGDMLLLVIAITAGWMIWRVMRFFGLIQAMTGLFNIVTKVGGAAVAATGSLEAMNLVSFVGLLTKLGLVAGALTFLLGVGSAGGEDPAFSKEKNEEYLRGRKPEDKDTGISGFMRRYLPTWMTGVGLTPNVDPGQVTGTPTASGTAVPAAGDQTNTVNQTNNVTINALNADDIPASLTKTFDAAAQNALDALARQARNASPKTEAAAQ
jgi:tape measure domain-containing protein